MSKFCFGRKASVVLSALLALSVCAGAVFLSGCSSSTTSESSDSSKLKVVASFYTMADFASMIGGDQIEVTTLVGQGVEPHDWEPSVEDIRTLNEADLVIINGAGMETWADKLTESGDINPDKLVTASQNIQLLTEEEEHAEGGVTDESASADAHESESEHADEAEHTESDGHDHGGLDPHVWLDPMNAESELRVITDALIERMPEKKDYFEQRYNEASEKLQALDDKYRDELSNVSSREIVVSHEAFGYMCKAYDLMQIPIQGLSADSEPDAQTMARIVDYIKEHNITTIFTEELLSPKTAEALSSETGVDIMTLNPIEGISEEDAQANKGYFELMEENLNALTKALA